MKAPRLAAALVAPLLLVAACGEDDAVVDAGGPEAVLARLQAAPDAVAAAGSARIEMTLEIEAMGERMEITASGGFEGDRSTFTMDMGSMIGGLGGQTGESVPPGFDEPMTIVVDGTTTYLKVPMLAMFTGTDGWLSVSPDELGVAGDGLGFGGPTSDPTQILESLRGISEDVEVVGSEQVRGVETTRYEVLVDLAKAAGELPPEAQAAFEEQMAELGGSTLPFDVWVGEDGLVYRMVMDFADLAAQLPEDELDGFESGRMVVELFDYGADLDIEVPDPSEVTPFAEVMGGFGALGPGGAIG